MSTFQKSYNSFSGVDIKAVFQSRVIGELQAISYSVTREKAPLYTMGSADPRSYSRGKRGIAGTLIFIMFDRHALLSEFGVYQPAVDKQLRFSSDTDDVQPSLVAVDQISQISDVATAITGTGVGLTVDQQESDLTSVTSDQQITGAWFADQLLPFDVTLAAANEYGAAAVMRIYGLEILNEGYGVSIDDIVSEQQMTYVARTLVPWRRLQLPGTGLSQSTG